MYILGFNMVEPGHKAHFFDTETPGRASSHFAGHNAKFENEFLSNLHENNKRVTVIK